MGCGPSKVSTKDVDIPGGEDGFVKGTPVRLGRLSIQGSFNQYEGMSDAKQSDTSGKGSVRAGGYGVSYCYLTQRGHYPDQPFKANQDAVMVRERFAQDDGKHLFAVFDGHGETGAECAAFCKSKLPEAMMAQGAMLFQEPEKALHQALLRVNTELHKSFFDDSLSGTTACVIWMDGEKMVVSNVGDSRAVLATRDTHGRLVAKDLSIDQTPFRDDEVDRVKACGARVLTLDQMEGRKDHTVKCWTVESECDGDPPRLWVQDGYYPGTAFTRSLGDSVAENIGVTAEAEHTVRQISGDDVYVILATDGVWEFVSSQTAVDMVATHGDDIYKAAQELAAESYRLWLENERRTDDITISILKFS